MATDRFQPTVTLSSAQAGALWPGNTRPSAKPAPQALPGDIIENPGAERPKTQ
jgi:hypothetical protein